PPNASQPALPPSTAPVLWMYSSIRPGLVVNPVIQPISWFGPATNPSRDIVKVQSTFPGAVFDSTSLIGRLLRPVRGLQTEDRRCVAIRRHGSIGSEDRSPEHGARHSSPLWCRGPAGLCRPA